MILGAGGIIFASKRECKLITFSAICILPVPQIAYTPYILWILGLYTSMIRMTKRCSLYIYSKEVLVYSDKMYSIEENDFFIEFASVRTHFVQFLKWRDNVILQGMHDNASLESLNYKYTVYIEVWSVYIK